MIDWTHWHNEPFLIGGLIFAGWLYALCVGPLRRWLAPQESFPTGHALRFYAAILVFYLAIGSPLDQMGERFLLSAHMIQHQLVIYGAAVLALLGVPAWLIAPVTDRAALRPVFRLLFNPIICGIGYSLTLSLWHAPGNYDLALRNKNVHVLEHLMFFGAALWYWWPILSPSKAHPPARYATQMIYLVGVTILMTPVFAFIAFADNVLYPTYEYAPRLIPGLNPIDDQLLGAAIMKIGGMSVTFIALVTAFYRWYRQSERRSPGASPKTVSRAA